MTPHTYTNSSPRILIVGANWVGDMVMAQSLFMTLKQLKPDCIIDVLAPAWTQPLLAMMPEVNCSIAMPVPRGQLGLKARYQLGKQLRANHYQQTILLPNSLKSALVPFFAKIPQRTGYVGEQRWGLLNDVYRLDKKALTKTVQRFVALALQKNISPDFDCPNPVLQINQQQREDVINKFALQVADTVIGLCPGAEYGPAKCWPAEKYAEVAVEKLNQGWDVWIFGSEKDRVIAQQINQLSANKCVNFAGETSLQEAVLLLSVCDNVVSNDSGLMHVAAALGKKQVAIYGSSDPNFTPPMNPKASIVSLYLSCSPCFKRECPLEHYNCLQNVSAQQVLAELDN